MEVSVSYGGICVLWRYLCPMDNFQFNVNWRYMCPMEVSVFYGGICVLWRYLCPMEVSVFYGGICVLWTTFSLMLTRNGGICVLWTTFSLMLTRNEGICVLWTHSLFIYRTCSYYLQTEGFLKLKKGSAIYLVYDFCNDRGSWLDFMF
jgi:hypothetical protein